VPVLFPVVIEAEGHQSALHATAINLGLGGVFVQSHVVPNYGAEVVVVIQLPMLKEAARLRGVVRWSSALGFGVQFSSLSARETHAIGMLVASERRQRNRTRPSLPAPA
jgi:hypothetical protein